MLQIHSTKTGPIGLRKKQVSIAWVTTTLLIIFKPYPTVNCQAPSSFPTDLKMGIYLFI